MQVCATHYSPSCGAIDARLMILICFSYTEYICTNNVVYRGQVASFASCVASQMTLRRWSKIHHVAVLSFVAFAIVKIRYSGEVSEEVETCRGRPQPCPQSMF